VISLRVAPENAKDLILLDRPMSEQLQILAEVSNFGGYPA
jgi:hypothetical protein